MRLYSVSAIEYDRYMIAQLTGIVTHRDKSSIILDVKGVGYRIFVSPGTLE